MIQKCIKQIQNWYRYKNHFINIFDLLCSDVLYEVAGAEALQSTTTTTRGDSDSQPVASPSSSCATVGWWWWPSSPSCSPSSPSSPSSTPSTSTATTSTTMTWWVEKQIHWLRSNFPSALSITERDPFLNDQIKSNVYFLFIWYINIKKSSMNMFRLTRSAPWTSRSMLWTSYKMELCLLNHKLNKW